MKKQMINALLALLLGPVLTMAQLPGYGAESKDTQLDTSESIKVAQVSTPAQTVLTGRVSNVDSLSREILRSEIKLEKYNLTYRLNAAKQGRWKGWRYFFFQESALGLIEGDLIAMAAYRGHNLHHANRVLRGPAANGTVLPAFLGFIMSGSGDALELSINAYHSLEAHKNGFSPEQSRRYIAGLVSEIDRKIAEREAMVREQPSSDPDVSAMQSLEGKLLKDFRNASLAEFDGFHVGSRSNLINQQAYYALDIAEKTTGAIWAGMTMHLILKGKERMCTSSGIVFIVNAAQTMLDPVLAHYAGVVAAKLDEKALAAKGLAVPSRQAAELSADCQQIKQWSKEHQNSSNAEIAALAPRVEVYDADTSYYKEELHKQAATATNARHSLITTYGWGLLVGGSKLPFGILPVIAGTKLVRSSVVNTYYFTGAVALMPAISLAIANSWRGQISGELNYQRQKNNHTLPGQIINSRMAALDKLEQQL
jgi:hypothetical protein